MKNLPRLKIYIFSFCFFLSGAILGGEVDQFSQKDTPLRDSRHKINEYLNDYLLRAIKEVNKKGRELCREGGDKVLYKRIQKYLNSAHFGEIILDLRKDRSIERITFAKRKDTIYRDFGLNEGFLWRILGRTKKLGFLSPIIRVGETRIGLDKLGHFFGEGAHYFRKRLQGRDIEVILSEGAHWEKNILGGPALTTGVFSYADLAANFNGFLFWNDLLKVENILPSRNRGPYIKCEKGRYFSVGKVDIAHYIDDSFNESINCSQFATAEMTQKVLNRIASMGMSCPMVKGDKLDSLREKYSIYSKYILNFDDGNLSFLDEGSSFHENSKNAFQERFRINKNWEYVPKEIQQMIQRDYPRLQYKRGSHYLPQVRYKLPFSLTSGEIYRNLRVDKITLKENLTYEQRELWFSFFSRESELTPQYLEHLRSLYTNEEGELDFLPYTQSLSHQFSLRLARDHFEKDIYQYKKGHDLKKRILEATYNKKNVRKDSLVNLSESKKKRVGIFALPGFNISRRKNEVDIIKPSLEYLKESAGFSHSKVIEVDSMGHPHSNALKIKETVEQCLSQENLDEIIFIAVSKGALDLITYLFDHGHGLSLEDRKKIKLVISLSGLVRGSYVARYLLESKKWAPALGRKIYFRKNLSLLRSLSEDPWKNRNRKEMKTLFPNLKWLSIVPIPDDHFGKISSGINSKIDFLSRGLFRQNKAQISIGDGLIESAATMLPPGTGIEEYALSYYGSHVMASGTYDSAGIFSVSPLLRERAAFVEKEGDVKALLVESAQEVLRALISALPKSLIE